jgi:protein tyrosine/serine phosphatase
MTLKKKIILSFAILIAIPTSEYIYRMHFNYNFETITKGKVYKSGVIEPSKIKDYVSKYHIRSIIDLRNGELHSKLNPATWSDIDKEKNAVDKIGGINYFHIPSDQVPKKKQLVEFFKVTDNPDNYPLLIHCHHGTGRAKIYSAIYRIEYEDFKNEKARAKTRVILYKSSFDSEKPKGKFLINYKKRDDKNSTIDTIR